MQWSSRPSLNSFPLPRLARFSCQGPCRRSTLRSPEICGLLMNFFPKNTSDFANPCSRVKNTFWMQFFFQKSTADFECEDLVGRLEIAQTRASSVETDSSKCGKPRLHGNFLNQKIFPLFWTWEWDGKQSPFSGKGLFQKYSNDNRFFFHQTIFDIRKLLFDFRYSVFELFFWIPSLVLGD